MELTINVADKHVWKARIVWAIVSLAILGNLAIETAGTAVDVNDKPILSAVALGLIVVSYPLLRLALRKRASPHPVNSDSGSPPS